MILDATTLSSAITLGLQINPSWFNAMGSEAMTWLQRGAANAWNYIKKIGQGAKAVVESVKQGNFGAIFNQWAAEDPLAAYSGVVAAGLAVGAILVVGGAAVAWVTGGVGAMAGSLGLFGAGVGVASLGGIVSGLMNQAEVVYSMNWQISDADLIKQMAAAVNSLYEPAGEFLGRSLAGFLTGGLGVPPKVEINVKRTALAMYLQPDIANDILDAVSDFAYTSLIVIRKLTIMSLLMKGRQSIKGIWKDVPGRVKKAFPKLDQAIQTWGDEDKEPWSFEDKVNSSIETIDDQRLQDAAQGFLSGFWNQFRDGVEKVYV